LAVHGAALPEMRGGAAMAKHTDPARARDRDRNILEWYEALISAVVILALAFSFVFRIIQVDGDSMKPTLLNGDKLIVWGAGYTPARGDVVIVDSETSFGKPLVKRVIATGGDAVDIDYTQGTVTVNGEMLDEEYLHGVATLLGYDVEFPLTVPEGTVFVMGDNRNNSLDSRSSRVGCIDERDILGKVLVRFLPIGSMGVIQ
jgi:signal peptidase I